MVSEILYLIQVSHLKKIKTLTILELSCTDMVGLHRTEVMLIELVLLKKDDVVVNKWIKHVILALP